MAKVNKGMIAMGLLMIVSGAIIAITGWDYKYDRPLEKWVGWIVGLYGTCMICFSISKK